MPGPQMTQTPHDSEGSFGNESFGYQRQQDSDSESLFGTETQQANIKANLKSEDGQEQKQFRSVHALRTKSEALKKRSG